MNEIASENNEIACIVEQVEWRIVWEINWLQETYIL